MLKVSLPVLLAVVLMVVLVTRLICLHPSSTPPPVQQDSSEHAARGLEKKVHLCDRELKNCQRKEKRLVKEAATCRTEVEDTEEKLRKCEEKATDQPQRSHRTEERKPFLGIGIPTVPRERHGGTERYLEKALKSIADQVVGVWDGQLLVTVMNMRPGEHKVFDECREKYQGSNWVRFVENHSPLADRPEDPIPKPHPYRPNQQRPTQNVRRQSLDVVRLLEEAVERTQYFLFYEDDFTLCENGLLALQYMISRATGYHSDWIAIRCSFGLSGIVMKSADASEFRRFLHKHYARRPPDHLVVEWYAGEVEESKEYVGERPVMAFRHNIAHHIGAVSSIRGTKHWEFPGCFAELIAPQVFPVEAWNPKECPNDDIWPCNYPSSRPSVLSWTTDGSKRVRPGTKVFFKDGTDAVEN